MSVQAYNKLLLTDIEKMKSTGNPFTNIDLLRLKFGNELHPYFIWDAIDHSCPNFNDVLTH